MGGGYAVRRSSLPLQVALVVHRYVAAVYLLIELAALLYKGEGAVTRPALFWRAADGRRCACACYPQRLPAGLHTPYPRGVAATEASFFAMYALTEWVRLSLGAFA